METKIVSSLEKCFIHDKIECFTEIKTIKVLKNERSAVQLLMFDISEKNPLLFL